jgi:hypothetical protein
MKKTVMTAIAVFAGVALQVQAQTVASFPSAIHVTTQPNINGTVGAVANPVPTTKLGLLNFSLANRFQAYSAGKGWGIQVAPNDPRLLNGTVNWDNISYTYGDAVGCQGAVKYTSANRTINNATIIGAINKALSWPVGKNSALQADNSVLGGILVARLSPYAGQFSTKAMLVAVNYDNGRALPPYPPTQDYVGDEGTGVGSFDTALWNAPWFLNGLPDLSQTDGSIIPLAWPNENYISWGKLWTTEDGPTWAGARVFIIDPKNANPNLQCFDVTPFFALEESYCYYCWDTMDRVTDGKITYGSSSSTPPCATGVSSCGITGSGTTRFYWTVKFDNVQGGWVDDATAPNSVLSSGFGLGSLYYNGIVGISPLVGDVYGWKLDDTDQPGSQYALGFTVSGVATYPWKFKTLSDNASWPMGTYSMSASGFGFSPMCGLFSGSVTMTEYDRSTKQVAGVFCLFP